MCAAATHPICCYLLMEFATHCAVSIMVDEAPLLGGTVMDHMQCSPLMNLPKDALGVILSAQSDTTLAILKNVSRDLRSSVTHWEASCNRKPSSISMREICQRVELLQWAHSTGAPWNRSTCVAAAKGGNLEALQLARELGCPWDEMTCLAAIWGGHLAVYQWARDNGCPCDAG